jgi:hypothetical protein
MRLKWMLAMLEISLQNFKCGLAGHRCAALLQFHQIGYTPGGFEKCFCLHFFCLTKRVRDPPVPLSHFRDSLAI